MNQTSQNLKGFRDFLPEEKRQRDWVLSKIITVFEQFGFEPLETPTLEYASLLLGKYGDEADKLVYSFKDKGKRQIGLRYDQTVPTARVLGQYQNSLPRLFRRYQVQNVFRADKPQRGRYREFTQCDIDIFGSSSPLSDAEILACTYTAYKNIGFEKVTIQVNTRPNLIAQLSPFTQADVSIESIIQSIDKLDKLPEDAIVTELVNKGFSEEKASTVIQALMNQTSLPQNLEEILEPAKALGINSQDIIFNPKLARGLDYYTGMIFEVLIDDYSVGSVGGGGRYDNLINELTGTKLPAVGMAFGFDRTVDAAKQLGLIPNVKSTANVLISLFADEYILESLKVTAKLRQAGINTELYPNVDKISKQIKLADQKKIAYVIIIGEEESKQGKVTLKNMQTGDQQLLSLEEAIVHITSASSN